nr:hypothetical protein [Prevotella scopos]
MFSGKEVRHRIVSIDHPYLRPIVRGKKNKRMEFEAKVNNIQVDGISFIEHHSIEAFNESVRLKQCIASITNRVGCVLIFHRFGAGA